MQRRLFPVPLWSAITIFAIVIVSIALAVLSPALRTQALSPLQGAAVAASQVAPVAQLAAAASPAPSHSQAPNNRWGANYIPNLPVIDQNGRTLHFYDDVIKGKIVVISFIYTSCQDLCPLTTARMAQLEDKLDGAVGRDLFFISMSV